MRHAKQRNKLSRDSAHRKALLRTMSKQLIQHERIRTTQPKAKALKPEFEKLITLAKRGDLHARRVDGRAGERGAPEVQVDRAVGAGLAVQQEGLLQRAQLAVEF